MAVLLLGTLDTKGSEFQFVREQFLRQGVPTLLVDAGVLGVPMVSADLSRQDFFREVGQSVDQLRLKADRGAAMAAATAAAEKLARRLLAEGKISAVFGLGGSAGTALAAAAARALPLGYPKVIVSTMASGDVRAYVGTRDVHMVHSVVDLAGLNRMSRKVLANAVHALVGQLKFRQEEGLLENRPVLAASMFGVTTPCVTEARTILEQAGYEVLVFHATGSGGQTLEQLVRDGEIAGVLDITTTELADELAGGILSAGPDRLTAAALKGIPQVVSTGALDMVNFGPRETVPEQYRGRKLYAHNPAITLMRTTPEENDRLGLEVANKVCAARGPSVLMIPLRGVSALDQPGQPFWWPEADQALFQSLRNWYYGTQLVEHDLHINDEAFARAAAETLLTLLQDSTPSRTSRN